MSPVAADTPTPLRGRGEYVTYAQLVDYVSRRAEEDHRARAETIVQLDKRLDSFSGEVSQRLQSVIAALDEHNRWHRDELSGELARGPGLRIAVVSAIFAAAAVLVAVITLLLTHGK